MQPGLNLDPTAVLQNAAGLGQGNADSFGAAGQNFLAAGQQALGGVNSFDAGAFAQDRYRQLSELAAPGEANAAQGLANSLFSRGRMGGGDTASGRAFGELAQAQSRANTERGIMSQEAASAELTSRIGQAGALSSQGAATSQAGQDMAATEQGRYLNALQGGGLAQGYNQQNVGGLLGLGIQGTQGIQEAFAPSRSAIQTVLAGSEIQQGGAATASQAIMQGGMAQSAAIGNITAGVAGGLLNYAGGKKT